MIRYCQISFPVSDWIAMMRLAAGTYMTPLTMIGVASEFTPPGPPRPGDPPAAGASLCKP